MEPQRKRDYEFELPVGYLDEDGRLHKTVRLHKMTGNEEALLADNKLRKNGGKLVTELLASCITALGDLETVNPQTVAHLTSADRNYLLLELRKITFGHELEVSYNCPSCGERIQTREDLDRFPIRRTNGGGPPQISVELEDGFEDREGKLHTQAVFRLPTGVDEERIAGELKRNPSRGMNALLSRCLESLGETPKNLRESLGMRLIADLTMADRARIERAMRQQMPGVDLRYELECDSCGRQFPVTLDMTGFFSLQ